MQNKNTKAYMVDMEREHIRQIQEKLRALGKNDPRIPEVFIDGIYGGETENAVRELQKIYGLPPTGAMDRETSDLIYVLYNELINDGEVLGIRPEFEIHESGTLVFGDDFDDIFMLQLMLRRYSLKDDRFFVPMNGVFDSETEAAVKLFQNALGEDESGRVNRSLWNSLIRASNDRGYEP